MHDNRQHSAAVSHAHKSCLTCLCHTHESCLTCLCHTHESCLTCVCQTHESCRIYEWVASWVMSNTWMSRYSKRWNAWQLKAKRCTSHTWVISRSTQPRRGCADSLDEGGLTTVPIKKTVALHTHESYLTHEWVTYQDDETHGNRPQSAVALRPFCRIAGD